MIFIQIVIALCAGWGFMDILGKFTRFPDWLRLSLLLVFSWVVAITL